MGIRQLQLHNRALQRDGVLFIVPTSETVVRIGLPTKEREPRRHRQLPCPHYNPPYLFHAAKMSVSHTDSAVEYVP